MDLNIEIFKLIEISIILDKAKCGRLVLSYFSVLRGYVQLQTVDKSVTLLFDYLKV